MVGKFPNFKSKTKLLMKKSILLLLFIASFANAQTSEKDKVNQTIDAWHNAAGDVKFDTYFNLITEDGIFIGTDATENWTKKDFKVWAKPFFDKGTTWNFTASTSSLGIVIDKT